MRKFLITGGSGQIGSSLVQRLDELITPEDQVHLLQHRTPVLTGDTKENVEVIHSLPSYGQKKYDVAIHLAANLHTKFGQRPVGPYSSWSSEIQKHHFDFYETNVSLTERVCAIANRTIYFSSDNIFKGLERKEYFETDVSSPPPNFYGETKSIAERIVLYNGGSVIRIQTLLGTNRNLIVDKVYNVLDGTNFWKFWNDQFVRPSHFDDLMATTKRVLETDNSKVYHVSCHGKVPSRADIARKVLQVHQMHGIPVTINMIEEETCTIPDFPRYLALNTRKTCADLGLTFMSVEEAIEKHVLYTRSYLKKEATQAIT